MGIFDSIQGLGNLNQDQTQGLLAAAAQILQSSGPSRMPTSFGQALGGGLGAYQQSLSASEKQRQEREQAALTQKLLGFKLKDAESDFTNQELQRKRAADLQQFYATRGQGGQGPNLAPLGNNVAPTMENAALLQSMNPAAAPTGGGSGGNGLYQQRLQLAQELRDKGFSQEADAAEASALKFQPKVKGWEKVNVGNRIMLAPYFEDGTSGQPVPLDVAEKLQFQNTGGKTLGLNPFTGAQVAAFTNTQTPDSAASVAATLRGQDLTNQRGLESNQIARDRLSVDKAPTEFQGKSGAYGLRAREADKILTGLEGKYSPAAINSKMSVSEWPLIGGALGAATNLGLSGTDQQAEQGQRDFINAVLRQESGAAIGAGEFDNARKQYFPQPGDKPETIAQKARNRQLAIQGLESNAGRAKMTAPAATGGWSIQRVGD